VPKATSGPATQPTTSSRNTAISSASPTSGRTLGVTASSAADDSDTGTAMSTAVTMPTACCQPSRKPLRSRLSLSRAK
jgi:hypothetical protein